MQILQIASIDLSSRPWLVSLPAVEMMVEMARKEGLPHPVVVRPSGATFSLASGAHALAVAQRLGWTELSVGAHVLILGSGDFDPRILDAARRDLSALDLAIFLAECKTFYEASHDVPQRGGDRKSLQFRGKKFAPSFYRVAAERTGYSDMAIRRLLQIGARLSPDAAEAVRGTIIEDSLRELVALSRLRHCAQLAAIHAVVSGVAQTVVEATFNPS